MFKQGAIGASRSFIGASITSTVRATLFRPIARYSTESITNNDQASTIAGNYSKLEARETFKHPFSRKTFLVDFYRHLNQKNEILLFIHHNNLNKAENNKLRTSLIKAGGRLNIIKNSLYNVYLRNENESDPAAKSVVDKNKLVVHPLSPLLEGPTAIIAFEKCDPNSVLETLKVLKTFKEKAFLIGAKIENNAYDINQIDDFKTLPSKESLQSQLAGVLTILGGVGLVKTLESTSSHLYLTMDARRKDLDPNEKKDEEKKDEENKD